MRNCIVIALGLALASLGFAENARTLQVDVTYTGAGKVDAGHKIYVALWDSPDFNSGPPTQTKTLDLKTGSVTFTNIQTSPAYITAAFDPTGSWSADSPPPSGTSLGMYSTDPPKPGAIELTPGKTAKVAVTFDDNNKIP